MMKNTRKITPRSDRFWRENLSDDVYQVCRKGATEPPFSGTLLYNQADGIYRCVCCGAPLFSSAHKYESGCGWPSFDQAIAHDAIVYLTDTRYGMVRTEIRCAACDSHLGHVFDDGPTATTGQRYCVNSVSLKFKAEDDQSTS